MSVAPTLLGAGILITVLHTVAPNHWLPFVVVGRASRWPTARTLRITFFSSAIHVGLTVLIGLSIALISLELLQRMEGIQNLLTGSLLIVVGLAVMALRGRRGTHDHHREASGRAAEAGLFSLMALAPCYPILPLFVSVQAFGWTLALELAATFAAITMVMMILLVLAASLWVPKVAETRAWSALRRREGLIVGGALAGLGLASLV